MPGGVLGMEPPHVLTFFKVEGVLFAVPIDGGVKIFRRVLGGAGAQAVEAQGKLVVVSLAGAVLAAGVELAEMCIRDRIRALAEEMYKLVYAVAPNLFAKSGPSCVATGRCPEGKMSCGKMKEVQAKYAAIHAGK